MCPGCLSVNNEVLCRLPVGISTHRNGVPRRLLRSVGVEILERRQLEVREEPPDERQLRLCSSDFRPSTRPGRAHILRRHPYEYVARTDITVKHAVLVEELMSWNNERQWVNGRRKYDSEASYPPRRLTKQDRAL